MLHHFEKQVEGRGHDSLIKSIGCLVFKMVLKRPMINKKGQKMTKKGTRDYQTGQKGPKRTKNDAKRPNTTKK